MLEEERPSHVVDAVRAVIEEAGPFAAPERKALAFAIRALGEVREPHNEPVRKLALSLTDAVVARAAELDIVSLDASGRGFSAHRDVLAALRFSGCRWPGSSVLRAAARRDVFQPAGFKTLWLSTAATAQVADRVAIVSELLRDYQVHPLLAEVLRELARLGPWTAAEVPAIFAEISAETTTERGPALVTLLQTGAASAYPTLIEIAGSWPTYELWAPQMADPVAPAIALSLLGVPAGSESGRILWKKLIRERGAESLIADSYSSAGAFIKSAQMEPALLEQAREAITKTQRVPSSTLAFAVAIWRDEALLRRWTDTFYEEEDISSGQMDALVRLAATFRPAAEALETVFSNTEKIRSRGLRWRTLELLFQRDPERSRPLLLQAMRCWKDGWYDVEAAKLLATWPEEEEEALGQLARWARDQRSLAAHFALDALSRLACDLPGVKRLALSSARDAAIPEIDRLSLIRRLAYKGDSVAVRIVEELAGAGANPAVRVRAAALLQKSGAPETVWRPVLQYFSRSAKTGWLRLEAAMALQDERRIEQLSRKAKRKSVRQRAAEAIERLRIHQAILAVGKKRRGRISSNGTFVGIIEETDTGTRFTYDPSYLASPGALALSPTLPLRTMPFDSPGIHPFFENLLPEGWLLDLTCRKLGLDQTDAFGVLLATCGDCAGSVEVAPERSERRAA